jgi:muramoyltetrapeptide carboxypeptidase
VAASVATGAATAFSGAVAAAAPVPRLLKPPRLKEGALVGLVAPGGVVDDAIIQACVRNLESLGFRVKPAANLRAAYGGYAGTAAQRLEDLHGMFRDREVGALWAARGGSGSAHLLPHFDYRLARAHPKILIGYSDLTALHLGILRHAGLVTFHGPVAWTSVSDFTTARMRAAIMEPQPRTVLALSEEHLRKAETQPQFVPRTYRAGVAEGRLVGGNLSVLCALLGTPHLPDTRGALLFIEEVGEAPYRIDRMLEQLRQAGVLARAAGIILGVFHNCEAKDRDASLTLAETLEHQLSKVDVPAVYGYSFGHVTHQYTLPVGVRARLDTEARTITLLEAAVA